jgi:hypothetical protein
MPSKMITDRQAQGRQVSAAIGVHAGEAAASLERHVQSVIGESIEAIEEMQLTLQRVFDAQLGSLVDTDEAHLDSEREAVGPRSRRDAARDELYSTLTEVRRLADALYGAGSLEPLGLTGPLSRRPEGLRHIQFHREIEVGCRELALREPASNGLAHLAYGDIFVSARCICLAGYT